MLGEMITIKLLWQKLFDILNPITCKVYNHITMWCLFLSVKNKVCSKGNVAKWLQAKVACVVWSQSTKVGMITV